VVPPTVVDEVNGIFALQAARVLAQHANDQKALVIDVIALDTRQISMTNTKAVDEERFKRRMHMKHLERKALILRIMKHTGLDFMFPRLAGVPVVGDCQDKELSGARLPMHWANPIN
jgi:hypothetical protein